MGKNRAYPSDVHIPVNMSKFRASGQSSPLGNVFTSTLNVSKGSQQLNTRQIPGFLEASRSRYLGSGLSDAMVLSRSNGIRERRRA